MRVAIVGLLLGLLLLSLPTCRSSMVPTGPAAVTLAGKWSLATVNGKPLPFVVTKDASNNEIDVVSDTYTFSDTLTFREDANYLVTQGSTVSGAQWIGQGNYAVQNDAVILAYSIGVLQALEWRVDELIETGQTPAGQPVVYIYRKTP